MDDPTAIRMYLGGADPSWTHLPEPSPADNTDKSKRLRDASQRLKSTFKAKLQELQPRLRKKKDEWQTCQQRDSLLFRLPPELREIIWQDVFAPRKRARPAHFHIYDEVYDSCTYKAGKDEKERRRRADRRDPSKTSLLFTCRAIYQEASRFLYQNTEFRLVLFAGLPRPYKHPASKYIHGKPENCQQLFSRMESVTIVVQPGAHPQLGKYTARIARVLAMLDVEHRLKFLRLQFNFHHRTARHDEDLTFRSEVIKAFYPLGPRIAAREPQIGRLEPQIYACHMEDEPFHVEFIGLKSALPHSRAFCWGIDRRQLFHSLRLSESERMDVWTGELEDIGMCEDNCLIRGSYGDQSKRYAAPPRPEKLWEKVFDAVGTGVTYVFLAPLFLPSFAVYDAARKKMKGNW